MSLKLEIDSKQKLAAWLAKPEPAVFQGQDLRPDGATIVRCPLQGCVFLGCEMPNDVAEAAAATGCLIMPRVPSLPFDPFSPGVYSPDELYDKFDPTKAASYDDCLDRKIYLSYMDPKTLQPLPADVDVILLRRLHDASIQEALDDLLTSTGRTKAVAIMGGHAVERNHVTFGTVANLALGLALKGHLIVTGGGPGLMEAANLGAYAAGFADPNASLAAALTKISSAKAMKYDHPLWLAEGFSTWKGMGKPVDVAKSQNIGIPTWFYGHEPPNVFATDIAKYFENSVREEGLLAVALGGVIFAAGNAGTVQEIFQDACQNYYRTYGGAKSPMVLFDPDYWAPPRMVFNDPSDKRKDTYNLLHKLAKEKKFDDYLLITGDPQTAIDFIANNPPKP